jgi:hypothetical protein
MSKVTIAGDVNGTGVFTIAAPNGNTNRTLTLPDVTATVITDSAGVLNIGAGQVYKDAIGNVGIGTSSPTERLGILSALTGTAAGSNTVARLQTNGSGYDAHLAMGDNVNASTRLGYLSGAMYFWTNGTERARIDTSGNLLVGTTSRVGSGKLSILYTSTVDTGIAIRSTIESYNTAIQFLNTAATQVGTINTTTTTTSYSTSSDYRLKNTIVPMTGALDKVALLKPCTYKWNADGSDGQGFIAHELAEAEPGCVSGEKDAVDAEGKPQYQGIDTSFLVATLAAAIQEQQAMLVSLKAIVDAQGAEIASLKGASA